MGMKRDTLGAALTFRALALGQSKRGLTTEGLTLGLSAVYAFHGGLVNC